jgi:ketosteroid isomerase-like protein
MSWKVEQTCSVLGGAASWLIHTREKVLYRVYALVDVWGRESFCTAILPRPRPNREGKVYVMLTESEARNFAQEWIVAWNSHDLEAILSHYGEDIVLTSPVAAKMLGDPTGAIRGKTALRNYFRRGLEAYPNLQFELLDMMFGISSVVLCYKNQKGTKSAEFMEFDANGRVARVVANYSG